MKVHQNKIKLLAQGALEHKMAGFASMKKSRMSFDQLSKKFDSDKTGNKGKDERMFYPQLDAQKNGQAVIRFLPESEGEESPWVKVYSHGFKGPGGQWFIEECPTTIGKDCPCCQKNSELWNSGVESDKTIARDRKRRMQYITNVLVIEDKKNPEREGKVMLYKFGAKIFDKLKSAMYPEFDGEVAVNPFDLWDGANFRLRIRKVDGNINYDKSEFASASPIASSDKEIEYIWNQQHKLSDFIDPSNYKSMEELTKQLNRALGVQASSVTASDTAQQATMKSTTPKSEATTQSKNVEMPKVEETDDAMDFFRKMAEE